MPPTFEWKILRWSFVVSSMHSCDRLHRAILESESYPSAAAPPAGRYPFHKGVGKRSRGT
ncbi:hypothetical protein GCM10009080_47470 [Cupriavidus pauculus]